MKEKKNKSNTLDREEYGFGYDISPDDLEVRVLSEAEKNRNDKKNKGKTSTAHNSSRLNK